MSRILPRQDASRSLKIVVDLPANHVRAGLETEAGLKSASRPTVIVGTDQLPSDQRRLQREIKGTVTAVRRLDITPFSDPRQPLPSRQPERGGLVAPLCRARRRGRAQEKERFRVAQLDDSRPGLLAHGCQSSARSIQN